MKRNVFPPSWNKSRKESFSLFLRAFQVCSPEFLHEEIRNIADKLLYLKEFVEAALLSAMKIYYRTELKITPEVKNVLVLPYNENLSILPNAPRRFSIQVVFKNSCRSKFHSKTVDDA